MPRQIIGHGTWYDKMALDVVRREQRLKRGLSPLRTESGIGASGLPHIGSLADATRSHAVSLAIDGQGVPSELIAFSDDKDGLRKVPAGFPSDLGKYLGFPVTSIPDPFGSCHHSFGEHVTSLLLAALDACNIRYRFMSGTEVYRRGVLNEQIEVLLRNATRVGEIVRDEVGQEKYVDALPYFPVCQRCGRIYTTRAYEFLPAESAVLYVCDGMDIGGHWIAGCGHRGEVDYRSGDGKLSWKAGEFAARWAAFGISFEAYGKDIADSVRVNDRICREILGFEPPLHVQYEVFLDKSGKKISKSAGNVFTPQVWFRYGSPQSLLLLTLKRFTGTRALSVVDIPRYMDELDELEAGFFGNKQTTEFTDGSKLAGLYRYCWGLHPPPEPDVHVPYNLLVRLAKVAPKGGELDFITEKLRSYGYPVDTKPVGSRIQYALNWVEDFEDVEAERKALSGVEKNAVADLIALLGHEETADAVQEAIFTTARKHSLKPRQFFELLYTALLGVPRGPRLGPYILDVGREAVVKALQEYV
jgi:lysyl-tRNA synthetase class 1